ncbi:hypothetical protein [Clostridium fungisolvens]|uniref:Uncharacterized protein n=1 Tax=Clostridium fungisolvens TaxID=1604897 RepID=A0A6V8SEP8_9CLOT|nr:hypothetical protein [Clostridium fungisolvens]GFP75032.1 hypothetical protein bsdtw1_01097 [Clostridium fungisolvens]
MKKSEIIKFLSENELVDIQEIEYKEGLVLRFFYDFDSDELSAAKAYSNEESDHEEESEEWYSEFFLPYLSDIALDNVSDVIDEANEEFEVQAQFVSYDIDPSNYNYNEFIAVFFEEDKDLDIDDVMDELGL